MSADKLAIGIVGAGRIGKVHADTIAFTLPQARLVSITDVDRGAAQSLADRCAIPSVAASSDDLLSDARVEAVLICSSTDTHARLIGEAARAGKHIFCEKPIAHDLPGIDAALEAVSKAGVKLQIGFNRRFDANFARVRRAVETDEIGQPRLLHIVSRDPAPPPISYIKGSGGIFLDMTIHDFDMARFLIGDEVEEIFVSGGTMVDPAIGAAGDLDTAVIVLRFRSGVIGTIENCRQAAYGYDQRVEILGSLGKIAAENCYPNQVVVSTGTEVRRDLPLNFFMDRYRESFAAELRAFVDAVINDQPTPVNGLDGRMPVVMGLAARKSCELGRPVRLTEVGQAVRPA
ncbi:MAG TPA: inositol 2-dehydrogenase [Candidatus Sulfopaludibacter sp.]|nr:inositol 2-dehydrogenase [Candidatus Sulfopaludibacter sp.]